MDWVRQGIEFDLQHNGTWLEAWGEPPSDIEARKAIFATDFETWPKLIPIKGHRFIRIEPVQSGHPVYSIMQTDIIYYGPTLADWLRAEFLGANFWSPDGTDNLPNDSAWDSFARDEGVLHDVDGRRAALREQAIAGARNTADNQEMP